MGHRLTKIYTRTGDDGSTGLADGNRVEKDSLRVDAIGDIDELNSLLGVLAANDIPDDIKGYLLNIQHRLFDLGGELAIPGDAAIEPESISLLPAATKCPAPIPRPSPSPPTATTVISGFAIFAP